MLMSNKDVSCKNNKTSFLTFPLKLQKFVELLQHRQSNNVLGKKCFHQSWTIYCRYKKFSPPINVFQNKQKSGKRSEKYLASKVAHEFWVSFF